MGYARRLRTRTSRQEPPYISIAFQFAIALSLAYLLISDTKIKNAAHTSIKTETLVARDHKASKYPSFRGFRSYLKRSTGRITPQFIKGRGTSISLQKHKQLQEQFQTTKDDTPSYTVKGQSVTSFAKLKEKAAEYRKPSNGSIITQSSRGHMTSNATPGERTDRAETVDETDENDEVDAEDDDEDLESDLEEMDGSPVNDKLPHKFRGVQIDPINEDNITRISFMLYRVIKAHNISSMIDIPCTKSVQWMPELLHYLDLEIPRFRYLCVVQSEREQAKVKKIFGEQGSPEFIVSRQFWDFDAPATDLAFVWNAISYMNPVRVWEMFKCLRKAGTKYVILGNHKGIANKKAFDFEARRINVRKQPFHFKEPHRVISHVSIDEKSRKQMLMYDMSKVREGL